MKLAAVLYLNALLGLPSAALAAPASTKPDIVNTTAPDTDSVTSYSLACDFDYYTFCASTPYNYDCPTYSGYMVYRVYQQGCSSLCYCKPTVTCGRALDGAGSLEERASCP
ncbi:hypothetical protein N431DRAFT_474867 [Stipitochalara longipes BDJ]|nr:hypothetical protein N431DRAFT_474867 [Stipitochalara longipes BDJ]